MNNSMQPFPFQGGMNYPSNPNMNYPNMEYPNMGYNPNMSYNQDIRNLENRVYNLEREVMRLKNKLDKLENTPISASDNYTSNYQPNSYNMM